MLPSLTGYRTRFRDRILDVLWRQWTSLGVSSHKERWRGSLIDPEALLLLTCTIGRHDARLFDGVLEWMTLNGAYLHVQRLMRILDQESFAGERILAAIADKATNPVNAAKWKTARSLKTSSPAEPLFFLGDGRLMPIVRSPDPAFKTYGLLRDRYTVRAIAQRFRPDHAENLTLRLRALLGVNARTEIFCYLLTHPQASPGILAREAYYFPLTISKAMAEMRDSGFLTSRINGRQRDHRLVPDQWSELLLSGESLRWIVWPRVFRAIEEIWLWMWSQERDGEGELALFSSLNRVIRSSVIDRIETASLPFSFGDIRGQSPTGLLSFVEDRLNALLDALEPGADSRATR